MTDADAPYEVLHSEPLRVTWADTDASGRIHWSAVFRWAEQAEHGLLRSLGRDDAEAGAFPRRAAEVVYHHPLSFNDHFDAQIGVERVGRTSLTFRWRLVRGGDVCVEGRHTVIHLGEDGRPAPWPEHLRPNLSHQDG